MKKCVSLVLSFLIMVYAVALSSLSASALTRTDFDNRLNDLRSKYPNYSTWYESFDGGSQCFGFARLMGYEVFGSYPSSWEISRDFNSVKAGDIVRYGNNGSNGHSIFVTNVSESTITFVDCNGNGNYSGATKVRSCGIKWDNTTKVGSSLFGYSFSYIRKSPDLTKENTKASNAWINVVSPIIISGEYQTFYFGADNSIGTYTLGIDYENERIFTENINGNSYSTLFTTTGNFSAYITAYGEEGYIDSNRVFFTVVKNIPASNAWITADKTNIMKSETIIFSYGATDSAGLYTIGIDKDNNRVHTDTISSNTYTYTFNESGNYSVYVTCYGYNGYADTQKIYITVSDPQPATNAWIKCNKNTLIKGETVIFEYDADNSAGLYTIGIDKDNKRVVTDTISENTYRYTFNEPGYYSVYVTCYGSAGFADTEKLYINVLDNLLLGDINNDGTISVQDTTEIQKYIASLCLFDEETQIRADVNKDGVIDVNDTTLIQEFCAGMISDF